MTWGHKLTAKVIVTATAGVVAAILGCATVVVAQGLPNDWSRQMAFSAPPSIPPEESNSLRYRILQKGIPEDWSHHHLIFSTPSTPQQRQLVEHEPRYWIQQFRRELQASSAARAGRRLQGNPHRPPLKRDWGMTLGGSGSTVGAGTFPTKYTFDINATPSCTADFVVFNTGMAGSSSQASILAYTNLYAGASPGCGTARTVAGTSTTNGSTTISTSGGVHFSSADAGALVTGTNIPNDTIITVFQDVHDATISKAATGTSSVTITITPVPKVLWAYNTSGSVNGITVAGGTVTSPVLSLDATQVAFVQAGVSGTTPASLVLLKWASSTSQTATLPGTPTAVTAANYRSCTAPCYTALAFSGGNTHTDTFSSAFYDYLTDIIYVGDDVGALHKFTNVFLGSPAESGSPFSTVSSGNPLVSPLEVSGVAFVGVRGGSGNGGLAIVNASGTAVVDTNSVAAPGLTDAPLIDPFAGEIYAVVSSNGSNTSVLQYPTNFTSSTIPTSKAVGSLSSTVATYAGAFDNQYFTSSNPSSPSGNLYVCGNAGGAPTLYRLPITSNNLGSASTTLALASGSAACSPVTEIYNGTTDRAFLSTTANGQLTGCSGACIYSFDITSGLGGNAGAGLSATGGTSGIILDNVSTQTGASQIYTSSLSGGTCTTDPNGSSGCAIQASQAALQ